MATESIRSFQARRPRRAGEPWRVTFHDGAQHCVVPLDVASPTEAFALACELDALFAGEPPVLDDRFAAFASEFRARCDANPPGGAVAALFRSAEGGAA